jgi:hypothetical protein
VGVPDTGNPIRETVTAGNSTEICAQTTTRRDILRLWSVQQGEMRPDDN